MNAASLHESLARRLRADLDDLDLLADVAPELAHELRMAVVAKLRQAEQVRSLSEQIHLENGVGHGSHEA